MLTKFDLYMGFHLVKTRGQPICVFISIYGAPDQRDSFVQVAFMTNFNHLARVKKTHLFFEFHIVFGFALFDEFILS